MIPKSLRNGAVMLMLLLGTVLLLGSVLLSPTPAPSKEYSAFLSDVKSGRANFTQTVTSPDGGKTKTSSGSFEFARPDRFRFAYTKPFEQLIVADGQKVWIHDPDLNQVSSRRDEYVAAANVLATMGRLEAKNLVPATPRYDASKNFRKLRMTWGWVPWEEPVGIIDQLLTPYPAKAPSEKAAEAPIGPGLQPAPASR